MFSNLEKDIQDNTSFNHFHRNLKIVSEISKIEKNTFCHNDQTIYNLMA